MTVFRDYDGAGLDAQYNLRARHPDFEAYFARWAADSARARAERQCRLDIAYGPHPRERLDVFPAGAGAPVLMFIHGGYWQFLDKELFSFLALPFLAAGVALVAISYPLAPADRIERIAEAARRAVAWVHANAAGFGGDARRLHVAGHSAGGHLAAMLAATDWPSAGLPADAVRGSLAISGVYDLVPISRCYLNQALGLDEAGALRLSPIEQPLHPRSPIGLAVGAGETEEFLRQQAAFAAVAGARGVPVRETVVAGRHHFDILEELAAPTGALFKLAQAMIAAPLPR